MRAAAGRGRGGGGGRGRGDGAPPPPPLDASKTPKETRKDARRAKNDAAVKAREAAEDAYFKSCQQEALKSGGLQKAKAGLTDKEADAKEKALFATQGAQGIEFDKYSDISGASADRSRPLRPIPATHPCRGACLLTQRVRDRVSRSRRVWARGGEDAANGRLCFAQASRLSVS